jgi:Holliday junction resolvase RusA-like endonuclease
VIKLVIPGLPLSSNEAYGHLWKIRYLTTKGKKYKNETTAYLAVTYRKELMLFKPNTQFQLLFRFYTELQNKNWRPGGKVENRYKKFDGANLTKLLEDVLADVGGYDDSQTMTSTWQKKQRQPGEHDRTEIWAWNLEEEHDPFDHDFILGAL